MGGKQSSVGDGWGTKTYSSCMSCFQAFIYFCQVWWVKCQNFVCFSDVRGFKPRFFEMPPRKQSVTLKICFTKMFADLQFWRLQLKELFGISVFGGKPIRFHSQPIGLFERLVDFHCQPAGIILLKQHIPYFTYIRR